MSYELHPSKLDHLGLAAAINSFCSELSRSREITIDFQAHAVPRQIPRDVMLCVFRVAQEALQNAAKYSGADRIDVVLGGSDSSVYLEVTDAGDGFVTSHEKLTKGLGITSMQERVRVVGGDFSITSAPGRGTRVKITVPLKPVVEADPFSKGRRFLDPTTNTIGVPPNETYTHNSR
jgi:signal transduction histidine kinase